MLTAAIITLLLFAVFTLYEKLFLNKRPECVCGGCGWEGKEDDAQAFSEDGEAWVRFCPECEQCKIIYSRDAEKP